MWANFSTDYIEIHFKGIGYIFTTTNRVFDGIIKSLANFIRPNIPNVNTHINLQTIITNYMKFVGD